MKLEDLVVGAIAALSPTASILAIRDHIVSRGEPAPTIGNIRGVLAKLERRRTIRSAWDRDESGLLTGRHYFNIIEGRA